MKETYISARSNPWVQQWLRYQSKPALRKGAGLVWIEGEHLVREALSRTPSPLFEIDSIIILDTPAGKALHQALLGQYAAARHVNCVHVTQSVLKALSSMDSMPSVCAVLKLSQVAEGIDFQAATVVLDHVQDPGNLGTVVRLCAAFGVPQLVLSQGCASAWGHKALRAAQGAQLAVTIIEDADLSQVYTGFSAAQLPIIATCLGAGSTALNQINVAKKMVWVFGNEGQGISAATQTAATSLVHIPMQGGFESLNVATAAAICLWQWQTLC